MKKILLIALGGTISAKGTDRLDLKNYQSGLIQAEQYLQDLPEIKQIAHVEIDPYDHISSTDITTRHWLGLRKKIMHAFTEEDYDGVVITHGTNTVEETAYFLHLTVPTDQPIILIGSQRPYTALSSDAHLNLLHGIKVATADESQGKGVLVVLNDAIHSARDVMKTNTYQLETFQSGPIGCLGFIEPNQTIHYYRKPTKLHTIHSAFSVFNPEKALPDIAIIYSYAGATGDLIDHIAQSGKYQGIVLAGTGAGLVSTKEAEALYRASEQGLVIVRSSRVGSGSVLPIDKYKDTHMIHADNLSPQKARILLMLSLAMKQDHHQIQTAFETH